jgi:3-deoxy-manno-octulosonate cytidylyltransferase (CMP-KDO synthetase)
MATGVPDRVVVATDSEEVLSVVRALGAEAVLTSPAHASGTDRVAEVAALRRYRQYELVLNVQGDEPFLRGEHLAAAAGMVSGHGFGAGTVASPVQDSAQWRDRSVVKVVRADDGRALYFSRAPIPQPRDEEPGATDFSAGPYLRHLGVYAYRRDVLARWVSLPPHPLETIERLEQLRPLAAGIPIGVAVVDAAEPGVDTPADALAADRRLRTETVASR